MYVSIKKSVIFTCKLCKMLVQQKLQYQAPDPESYVEWKLFKRYTKFYYSINWQQPAVNQKILSAWQGKWEGI